MPDFGSISMHEKLLNSDAPNDFLYTEDDSWALPLESGAVRVGITDFAQIMLKDIMYIELPETGISVIKGEEYATVESVKTVIEIISPISGTITAVNNALTVNPELVNASPYFNGWICEINPHNWATESATLLNAGDYKKIEGL